ncbi:glutathione S-transferase kappa 1 isoform X3 [Dromaius novaehollandiae]|uniref:glutathione S-transferase kappa 1 isoform X3 n=1 Tax=Dromaius novaehollandiae TaxID=8790 RepID=UPI00311D9477
MAAARTLVELFYDVVSPYSWLGFEVLCRYQHIWNIDLRFRPAFLGGIMQATGNKPPAMLPKRAEYLLKDIKRMGKYYQVPVQISADDFQRILGKGSLGAMRFITAIDMTQPQFLEPVSREFWIRFWSQHEDINQPASILAVRVSLLVLLHLFVKGWKDKNFYWLQDRLGYHQSRPRSYLKWFHPLQ